MSDYDEYDSDFDYDSENYYEDDYSDDKDYKSKKKSPEIPSPSSLPQKSDAKSKPTEDQPRINSDNDDRRGKKKKKHKKKDRKRRGEGKRNKRENDRRHYEEKEEEDEEEEEEDLAKQLNVKPKHRRDDILDEILRQDTDKYTERNDSKQNNNNDSKRNNNDTKRNQIQPYSNNVDYGNSTKASIIVEAKKEYTLHLHLLIDSFFCDEFETLYQHCIRTVQPPDSPIKDFLKRLKRIPIASDHYKARILERFRKSGGDEVTLLGILKALFISHVQLLLSIRVDSDKKAFQLDIPPIKDFLFECMIEIAKGLYELYTSNSPDKSQHKNTIIIRQAIEQAVTKHIPIKQILFSFRDNPNNPNNIMVIPCTPIVNSSNAPSLNFGGNLIRSPVVGPSWVPPSTPSLFNNNNNSGYNVSYNTGQNNQDVQPVNLKEQKVKDNAKLKQVDDGSDDGSYDGDKFHNPKDKRGIFNEVPSPSKNDESNENEFKTIRTRNDVTTERQGSKELKIKM